MHVSELLNGCLVCDCQLLHLTCPPTQKCPFSTQTPQQREAAAFPTSAFFSHLLLLLSPQLLHLRAMLRPQVLGVRQVTLSKALLHGGQLRLLLQLQLLQLPLKGHLQRRLLPMESLPARRVGCCAGSRVYCVVNMSELCTATIFISWSSFKL